VQTDCPVLLLAGNKQEECGPNRIKVAGSAIRMDIGRSFTIAVDIYLHVMKNAALRFA